MSHLSLVSSGKPTAPRGTATSVRVEAPGKVNLFLSCGAAGLDGYHELTTVFQAVRLIETVTARRQSADRSGQITLSLDEPDESVPLDERNLAYRAAALLAEHTGSRAGVDLVLRKRVPVAGGMAGGSADAAATLLACNQLWGSGLSLDELMQLARQLGADCPFPLLGGTAVGSGRGDELSPLMTRGSYHWVFALAHEGLSTPAVFARLDEMRAEQAGGSEQVGASLRAGGSEQALPAASGTPAVSAAPAASFARPLATQAAPMPEELGAALRMRDTAALAACLHNDLEEAALSLRPELADVIALAEEAGALRAIVSGSGPTIAALVPDPMTGMRVSRALEASPLVAGTVRADAPVAGSRVVG